MKRLALAAAVSTVIASPTFAAATNYTGTATSGTAAAPLQSIVVTAASTTNVYYVDNSAGTASNKTGTGINAPVQLVKTSNWSFDFTNLAAVTFTGNIVYGDYKTQTNVPAVNIDGRQTFIGVTQSFSGTGSFNSATNTFTFNFMNGTVNGQGGSVQTQTSSSCANGATSIFGKVCSSFASATPSWEGLSLTFVFSADKSTFSGALQGTDTSGGGATANTTKINWQISGSAPTVPVPAAAWLFGSGVVGLAGVARRRRVS